MSCMRYLHDGPRLGWEGGTQPQKILSRVGSRENTHKNH